VVLAHARGPGLETDTFPALKAVRKLISLNPEQDSFLK
jgi:hypothetical protein